MWTQFPPWCLKVGDMRTTIKAVTLARRSLSAPLSLNWPTTGLPRHSYLTPRYPCAAWCFTAWVSQHGVYVFACRVVGEVSQQNDHNCWRSAALFDNDEAFLFLFCFCFVLVFTHCRLLTCQNSRSPRHKNHLLFPSMTFTTSIYWFVFIITN